MVLGKMDISVWWNLFYGLYLSGLLATVFTLMVIICWPYHRSRRDLGARNRIAMLSGIVALALGCTALVIVVSLLAYLVGGGM